MDYSNIVGDEHHDHPGGSSPWGASPSASPEQSRTSFSDAPISPIPYNPAQTRSEYSSDHDTIAGEGSAHNGSVGPSTLSENDSDRRPNTADSMPDSSDQRYLQQQQSYMGPQQSHMQHQQQHQQQHSQGARAAPKQQYKLQAKITGLERTGRKDPILRFDVYVSYYKLVI